MTLSEAIVEIHKLVKDPTDVIKIPASKDAKVSILRGVRESGVTDMSGVRL